ncbi:MAG: histidinol dehydrogenase [Lentisphaeraceae bacterium]|nr:histidinol dehydrogenase [Lentisphaeraceae bacterium]
MIFLKYNDAESDFSALFNRTAFPEDIEKSVATILSDIRNRGDKAVIDYAKKFDNLTLSPENFRVTQEEIDNSENLIDDDIKDAIQLAHANILDFSKQSIPQDWKYNPRDGVTLGEKFTPLERIACYVPGGTAPLVSTVLHTATMAKAAGVPEIVITTKGSEDGSVNPAILYAAKVCGATEVYKMGGVYAVGALAFGTDTIKKVDKIVGPGNAYVTAAKKQVYGYTALDLVAGPSEIMVLADKTAPPAFIAADLLSQAEHGSGFEQAVLVSDDANLLKEVEAEVLKQKELLSRAECIDKVVDNGIFLIEVANMDEAAEVATLYAAEHLEIMTEDPEAVAENVKAAGAIFLGPWTPEPLGDFVAGPSHVLPTGGSARYFNGLTVNQFFRRTSLVKYSEQALAKEVDAMSAFAKAEGLDAHGRSGTIRFDK